MQDKTYDDFMTSFIKKKPYVEQLENGSKCIHLSIHVKNEDIDAVIRQYLPDVLRKKKGIVCAITDYDFDERELYQIPEVKMLCKRLVERGFISVLVGSCLIEKKYEPWLGGYLGAMEIWAFAEDLMNKTLGNLEITPDLTKRFIKILEESNKVADRIFNIEEGHHRTKL